MDFKDLIKISKVQALSFLPVNFDNKKIGGGIYRMYDNHHHVIYVGKSQNLYRRLHQHIGKDTNTSYFIDEAVFFEWLPESNPIYQNLLEAIFIAYHRPKYNDEVKDMERGVAHG